MTTRKPLRNAFLMRALLVPILLWSVVAIVAGVVGSTLVGGWLAVVAAVAWLALSAWTCVVAVARCRKEHYEIHADRIIVRRGGLLSDEELEVHYPKITHVNWVRPWLRHKLFGVGDLYVEVAGSDAGSIALLDIVDSDAAQLEIRKHMQKHFSMRTDELLHEGTPSGLAILLDVPLKSGWALIVGAIAIGSDLVEVVKDVPEIGLDQLVSLSWIMEHAAWLLLAIPVAIIWLGFLALRCLDLKRRNYRVYNGLIEYREGFLTRNDAFMPVENLSNSEVTRGLVERIANVFNVVISCQGAGQQVAFLYLREGEALKAVLDKLIDQTKAEPLRPSSPASLAASIETDVENAVREPPPLPREITCPDLSYRMHVARCLVPKLGYLLLTPLLIMVPPVLLILVYRVGMEVIRMLRTTYTLGRSSVEENFEFIRVEQREFSREKVTGIVIREHLFDRMFKTVTIQFWSIGAGKAITFRNVRKTEELMTAVHKRFEISREEPLDTIASNYGLGRFLSGNLTLLVFDAVLIVAAIVMALAKDTILAGIAIPLVLLPLIGYLWGIFYYRTSKLELHEHGMKFRRGIITRAQTWAAYDNVKDVTTMKYPGFDAGAIRFNVAGERSVGNAGSAVPYGFTLNYVPDLEGIDERFDYDILSRDDAVPSPSDETIIEARKALRNTLARTLLVCVIIFPLLVLLPIVLPIALWRASLVRYRIENGRVLMRTGRLFRQQRSILFSRIDHIQTSQGAINKLLGAGNVIISTAGSSKPELVLRDVIDHEIFYQTLRAHHRDEDATPVTDEPASSEEGKLSPPSPS